MPWQREAPPSDVKTEIVGFLLRHYGDARLPTPRWLLVGMTALAVMCRWLTEETVVRYFRLAGEAKTANRKRLMERT